MFEAGTTRETELKSSTAEATKGFDGVGFRYAEDKPGVLTWYGSNPREHSDAARQVCAEIWTREFVPGKGWHEYWRKVYHANHYLDVLVGNCVAASICGVRLIGQASGRPADTGSKPRSKPQSFALEGGRKW